MKKLFLFLSISFSLQAQSDSLKVTFSEEKVEKFEKTTLIDEYEKAFGGNRLVTSALRLRLLNNPTYGVFDAFQLQFEKKLKNDFSITIKTGSAFSSKNSSLGVELKKFNNSNLRNLNGEFRGVFIEGSPLMAYLMTKEKISSNNTINWEYFHGVGSVGIFKGKQFGNNLAFGLKGGLKIGSKSIVNDAMEIQFGKGFNLTPFISTYYEVGFGFLFPQKKKIESNSCDFLNCRYETKKMQRLNLSNLLYFDFYEFSLSTDYALERKIGKSPFSVNTQFLASTGYKNNYLLKNVKDTILIEASGINSPFKVFEFENSNYQLWSSKFGINEQLRIFPNQRKKINSNKAANNLNGFYLGIFGEFNLISRFSNKGNSYQKKGFDKIGYQKSIGILSGIQSKISKKAFISGEIYVGIQSNLDEYFRIPLFSLEKKITPYSKLNIKVGLAK